MTAIPFSASELNPSAMTFIPFGGCGEIGMNLSVLAIGGRFYGIDAGCTFPNAAEWGVDLVLPSLEWLEKEGVAIQAWILTHGHEDHIGALAHVWPKWKAPIYGSPFTLELVKGKFQEFGLQDAHFHPISSFVPVVFPDFTLTPFAVNHSIPDSLGLLFESAYGSLLHSCDFRRDPNGYEGIDTIENLMKVTQGKKISLMISDSTNPQTPGTDASEQDLIQEFVRIFSETQGAVIVGTFASHIWRLRTILQAAEKANRKVVVYGRNLVKNHDTASTLGLMDTALPNIDILSSEHTQNPSNLCIVCTGSQGEVFAGLYKFSKDMCPEHRITGRDTVVFSSRPIPGNEMEIESLHVAFLKKKARVITARDALVHVSGHGFADDLKWAIEAVAPTFFTPIHGTWRTLHRHAELALKTGLGPENIQVIENGDVLEFSAHHKRLIGKIPTGRIYLCEGLSLEASGEYWKCRTNMARYGMAFASYTCEEKHLELHGVPRLSLRGIPPIWEPDQEQDVLREAWQASVAQARPRKDFSKETLQEELRLAVRKRIEKKLGYKCMVVIHIHWL